MLGLIKTKTFWAGVALIIYGITRLWEGEVEGIREILEGLGIIFLRHSIAKK